MPSDKAAAQLTRRVRRFIEASELAVQPGPLVIGVSGGPDSVCLLHVLVSMNEAVGLDLHVAHLNHQLRGAESDGDAAYVLSLAERLGVPATVASRDVQAYRSQMRVSLEEAAREVRYAFFDEVAQSIGAKHVVVGHTADDQAETILMHLIRGAGLSGLCGMRSVSERQQDGGNLLTIIRPLLEVSREETQAYCAAHNLSPRIDSSNASGEHLRNRIRGNLVPHLQQYNPKIGDGLIRLGRLVRADVDYLGLETAKLWGPVVTQDDRGVSIDHQAFNALPLSLKRHLLRSAWRRLIGDMRDIEQTHIESMIDLLEDPAGKRLSLPEGLYLLGGYRRSLISREEFVACPLPPLVGENELVVPGETVIDGWRVKAQILKYRGEPFQKASHVALFDLDVAGTELMLRSRRDGDRFQPLGMKGAKKLQDFMVDAKIPRDWRDRVPLICAQGRILWVVGWRIGEWAKVRMTTERLLKLEFETVG